MKVSELSAYTEHTRSSARQSTSARVSGPISFHHATGRARDGLRSRWMSAAGRHQPTARAHAARSRSASRSSSSSDDDDDDDDSETSAHRSRISIATAASSSMLAAAGMTRVGRLLPRDQKHTPRGGNSMTAKCDCATRK